METKLNDKENLQVSDEVPAKRSRIDWKSVENLRNLLECMREPIRWSDLMVRVIKDKGYESFKDGTLRQIMKRVEPVIGPIKDKSTGLFHVADVDTAIELYKIHIGEQAKEAEIEKTAEEAGVDLDESVIVVKKRGATGPRYQTWKNILDIIKIIKSNGNRIKIVDLISKFKKVSGLVSFNVQKFDEYAGIMESLGIPFDFSHNKRVGLTELNCDLIIAQKYNESKSVNERKETNFIKKTRGVRGALLVLTKEEQVAIIIQVAKLLYFYRSSIGMKFVDIPVFYKREYLKDISMELVMAVISELKAKLQDEKDFKVFQESAKLYNYTKVLDEFKPDEKFITLVLKVPSSYDINAELLETSTINQVDDSIFEISSVNDERLVKSLMRLIVSGGRILSPSRIEKRILGILDERIKSTEIMIS